MMTVSDEFKEWYEGTHHAALSRLPEPPKKRFRYSGVHRQWVGKPDPSGIGIYTLASDDRAWLERQREIDIEFGRKPGEIKELF